MRTPLQTAIVLLVSLGLALEVARAGESRRIPGENATEAEFRAFFGSMTEQPTTPGEIKKFKAAVAAYTRLLGRKEREIHPPLINRGQTHN